MKSLFSKILFCLTPVIFFISCDKGNMTEQKSDTVYHVTVKINGLDTGALVLSFRKGDNYVRDTTQSTNGTFEFYGAVAEPAQGYLRLTTDDKYDQLKFFMENTQMGITANRDSLSKAKISGSPLNDQNQELQNQLMEIDLKLRTIYSDLEKVKENKKATDSLKAVFRKLRDQRATDGLNFIFSNPNSYVSAYHANDMFFYNPDVNKFDSTYNVLSASIKSSWIGKQLEKRLAATKRTAINQTAPEFTLKTEEGNELALSSLRGKIVLIDFWASWCGPCREENPNLIKAYDLYKQKGFEILGVSIDDETDRNKWLEAIKKDKLAWPQVIAPEGWKSEIVGIYGIDGIPMNFLLDKDGKIIAKGLRGGMVEEKLKSLL